ATVASGEQGVHVARDGRIFPVPHTVGPLGPTMNDEGVVAFRAESKSGVCGIYVGREDTVVTIADTAGAFSAFHGVPVINAGGAVVFRADLKVGGQGIYLSDDDSRTVIAETGDLLSELGSFPILNDAGTAAFTGTLRTGGAGIFKSSAEKIETIVDTRAGFDSFRGVLIDRAGRFVFYATPIGGQLGIFTGPNRDKHKLLALGEAL